jgi:hypothetical protein
MQQMYHPSDLATMDPLVLMKNLDHVRMTSRRLSYILQQQVHLYTPEANQLREQIDRYVEAERQIEGEMAWRHIRACRPNQEPPPKGRGFRLRRYRREEVAAVRRRTARGPVGSARRRSVPP